MNPLLTLLLSTVGAAFVSGIVGLAIAAQNRRASKDVAQQTAHATVESSKEQAEEEAYTRARGSLESVIAHLETENGRIRDASERCAVRVAEQSGTIETQATQIETLTRDVRHLRNQDAAKQRIIDRMAGELRAAKAALALKFPDE